MLIGLTGGIGCGKSTALSLFQQFGWRTVDADAICRDLYAEKAPRLIDPLVEHWGDDAVFLKTGQPDKAGIANIVFGDSKEMAFLEKTLHPLIKERAFQIIDSFEDDRVIFDIPLLFESGWDKDCDKTIAVWATREMQYQRLYDRGWSDSEIERRIKTQLPSDEKLQLADYALINTGNIDSLTKQCGKLSEQLI